MVTALVPPGTYRIAVRARHAVGYRIVKRCRNFSGLLFAIYRAGKQSGPKSRKFFATLLKAV